MTSQAAAAVASPNIALIKYWGNIDHAMRLPANGSISMTLGGLETRIAVTFDECLAQDTLTLNGKRASEAALARVSQHLDRVRHLAGARAPAHVESQSNFPMGAGIASSASAFAAITVAARKVLARDAQPKAGKTNSPVTIASRADTASIAG
jgi:diphosphomevalonate decarboxylase